MQNTHIPIWLQMIIFAIPAITIAVETLKFFLSRSDTKRRASDASQPAVQVVQGTDFSMDREMITMLRNQMAQQDSELIALRKQNMQYLRLLLMNGVPVPDDAPETMF